MKRLHLPIHEPCNENWDAMSAEEDGKRFCEMCTKDVHDLSTMTERQARDVLAIEGAKGRVCVRYRPGSDGEVLFKPETTLAPSFWQTTLAAASVALMMLTGCSDTEPTEVLDDKCVYERGPLTFELARGEGTCPAVDIESHSAIPEPDPDHEVMGKIGEPDPVEPEVMGDIAAVPGDGGEEPCDSGEPVEEVMGEAPDMDPAVLGEPEIIEAKALPESPRMGGISSKQLNGHGIGTAVPDPEK